MLAYTPAEYAAFKANSPSPHCFPDDDTWGNYQGFFYPLLVCPVCGYKLFEGYVRSLRHLAWHFPDRIGEEKKEEKPEEPKPEEPEEPKEEEHEEPEEPEELPLLQDMLTYKPWEEEWLKAMAPIWRRKREEEEARALGWGFSPKPPEEDEPVVFFSRSPLIGLRLQVKLACETLQAQVASNAEFFNGERRAKKVFLQKKKKPEKNQKK